MPPANAEAGLFPVCNSARYEVDPSYTRDGSDSDWCSLTIGQVTSEEFVGEFCLVFLKDGL